MMAGELDPHFRAMLEQAAARDLPRLETLTPAAARQMFRAMRHPDDLGPQTVTARDLRVNGGDGPIDARLYTPVGAAERSAGIVYFHGGGWVMGDLDTHDAFCRRLCESSGARVLAVDYRLAPEHPFPASHDDGLAATRWVFDHSDAIGIDAARVAVAGDSAGGNLAASVALDLKGDPRRQLAFQALFYPVVRTETDTASYEARSEGFMLTRSGMRWFLDTLGSEAGGHPRVHLPEGETLAGLPPAFVSTAGFDPLRDEGAAYAEALKKAAVKVEHRDYPGFIHGFYAMPLTCPPVNDAIADAGRALREGLAPRQPV